MEVSITSGYECEYFKVSPEQLAKYENAYPGMNVALEMDKMVCWLDANENRRPKKYPRFIVNWLAATHGRLLEVHTMAQTRESMRWEKDRAAALVGKWSGYR